MPSTREGHFLGNHAALPPIVAHGREPNVFACGCCHRADGSGGPENASVAGLPAAYIVEQLAAYKNGTRRTSVPQRLPPMAMISLSKAITGEEVSAAAAYFSALKPRQQIRVVETDTVPKTFVAGWFLAAAEGGGTEALGSRIVEVPENLEQFENRDTRSRFVAYVPPGSVARGGVLAGGGGAGATHRCAACHGPDLKGAGRIFPIAGRSPSYVVRQLYDMQSGARAGGAAQLMKPTVARLSVEDMVAIAANLASRTP
jgi:cytochrome c553